MRYYLSAPFGLEGVVKNEVKKMDIKVESTNKGYVIANSKLSDMAYLNMNLRVASRVYLILAEFKARNFDELYDNMYNVNFEDYILKNSNVIFNAKSFKSKLFSLRDIQRISKKAYIQRYKNVYNLNYYEEGAKDYSVTVRIEKDNVYVLLDTSGDALHKRFWRKSSVDAPIRENFAAGLIMLSRYFGKGAFIDPMCGSGTFVIEAAMISKNIAPGINRSFSYDSWGLINRKDILNIKNKLQSMQKNDFEFPIEGYDISNKAIEATLNNAKSLELDDICIKQRAIKDFKSDYKGATVVSNFPYGKRLLDNNKVEKLELEFNENVLSNDSWFVNVLSSNDKYPYTQSRKASKIRKFLNGQIATYFYEFKPITRW